jgi:hypothetical protein
MEHLVGLFGAYNSATHTTSKQYHNTSFFLKMKTKITLLDSKNRLLIRTRTQSILNYVLMMSLIRSSLVRSDSSIIIRITASYVSISIILFLNQPNKIKYQINPHPNSSQS